MPQLLPALHAHASQFTVDGRDAVTSNPDNEFEYAGRLFFEPFRNDASFWSGLGFGIGGSVGDTEGTGNNFLPRYRTPGQVQFFSYRAAVAADGRRTPMDAGRSDASGEAGLMDIDPGSAALPSYIENLERVAIQKALEDNRWNKTKAAAQLGITFRALRYKLKKLGME